MEHLGIQYIHFLWGLTVIPIGLLIYFSLVYKKKKRLQKVGDAALVATLTANYKKTSFPKKYFTLLGIMVLLIVSLANIRTPVGGRKITRSGTEVMIALDVSKSMLAQDLKPDRLQRAKQLLERMVEKLPNDKIGICVFAGRAYLQMPLSADHTAAKMFIGSAAPESIPTQGTVIGDALNLCAASFATKEKKYKTVIVISDGEDHDEAAISAAKDLSSQGIIVHTVGIGTPEGSPIPDAQTGGPKTDRDGQIVISKLNEQILKDVAEAGGGIYQLYSGTETVATNLATIVNNMDKFVINDDAFTNFKSFFQVFVGLAIALIIAYTFISEVKKVQK